MLVLVSFGLVLLATILLVVGLLTDDGLTLIYFSIAASFTAAVVLYLAFRRARPKADTDAQPPEPIAPEGAEDEVQAPRNEPTTITPVVAATPEVIAAASPDPDEELEDELEPVGAGSDPAVEVAAASDDWTSDDDWADDGEFDVEFPIADYDELTVAEIMPLLPQLYSDELGIVAERERSGQARASILARLDELAATGTEADALEAEVAGVAAHEQAPAVDAARNETLATPRPAAPAPRVPSLSDDDEYDDIFPIADYDELSVDQIVPLLAMLEDDELEDVKAREAAGQGRKSVISEIDRQLGLVEAADAGSDLADDGWAVERPAVDATVQAEQAMGSALAIAGYDGLTVAQVRPLLAGLSEVELRAVLEHETARDNRRTIVADIERRLDGTGAEPVAPPAPAVTRTPRKAAVKKAAARKVAARAVAPAKKSATVASRPARKTAAKKSARATKKASAPRFPIAGYDELTVAQIRPRLNRLSDDQLLLVRAREESGAGRRTILNDIDGRLR